MFSAYRVQYQMRSHRRDPFIELIKHLLSSHFAVLAREDHEAREEKYRGVFQALEQLVQDHIVHESEHLASASRLTELVPSIGTFFTPLCLTDAFDIYNRRTSLASRRYIPPSFNDIRFILNLGQLKAIASGLQLITFDGDATLYPDGHYLESDRLLSHLISLLKGGIYVALVTAAGYANDPSKYEERLGLLFEKLTTRQIPSHCLKQLFVMGGECNFLYKCTPEATLASVDFEEFATQEMKQWSNAGAEQVLDVAEASLKSSIQRLKLNLSVLRKVRGVGTICCHPSDKTVRREQLDELTLSAKHDVLEATQGIPFCAFNGGSDVWIDVGNKHFGVQAVQNYLKCEPHRTLHVGDQFLSTGNDIATRKACPTVWVATPDETADVLDDLLYFLGLRGGE